MQEEHPELQRAVAAISDGDFERSFAIVRRLAQADVPLAQHFLGWHYHKGIGTEQDDSEAVRWWLKAARQGVVESQQGLGWAYANGRGVEEDPVEAYRWLNRAASRGDEAAREDLLETARRLSPEQLRALEQDPEY
jgi:TPR repeat protein